MNIKSQKGFSALELIVVLIVVVLIGVVGYLVYQQVTKPSTPTPGTPNQTEIPIPEDPKVSIDEPLYKLTLPSGWQKTSNAPNTYVGELMGAVKSGGSVQYFRHSSGDYFAVSVEPLGRGFEANETWQLNTTATGFTVGTKNTCTPGADFCTPAAANEYRIGMTVSTPLKGHEYFFFAGNSSTKTPANSEVFQKIIESFTAK